MKRYSNALLVLLLILVGSSVRSQDPDQQMLPSGASWFNGYGLGFPAASNRNQGQ